MRVRVETEGNAAWIVLARAKSLLEVRPARITNAGEWDARALVVVSEIPPRAAPVMRTVNI